MDQPAPADSPVEFSDAQSQRVFAAAATAVAGELGRQAARAYFADVRHERSA